MDGRGVLVLAGPVGDGEELAVQFIRTGIVAEFVTQQAQERDHPPLAGEGRGGVIGVVFEKAIQPASEDVVEVTGILENGSDLLYKRASGGEVEVGGLLPGERSLLQALQDVRAQEPALQPHRRPPSGRRLQRRGWREGYRHLETSTSGCSTSRPRTSGGQ
jgi:hypothetical protein